MIIEPKFTVRSVLNLAAAIACLIGLPGIGLFGQTSDAGRIGVCNAASELKPIEVEADAPDHPVAYPNLSEAFYAINQGVHTGEINIEVCFDSVEREAAVLNSAEMKPADFSKVTIRPLKDDLTITSKTGFNALIALNGTDNITIDGDNPNTAGENRNLTIRARSGRAVIAVQTRFHSRSRYDSASNNTLRNLNISGIAVPTYGIALGGHNPGSNGDSNHHNAVINCKFRRVRTGIFSGGKSPGTPNIETIISNNDLAASGDERIRLVGIQLEYESNAVITENRIGGLQAARGEIQDEIGIRLGGGRLASLKQGCRIRCYRSVSDSLIARNIISGIIGGKRQSVAGIYIYGDENTQNTIQNNVIAGVTGSARVPNVVAGIFVAGYNDSKLRIYNNSVAMTGERGSVEIHNPGFAFVVWGEDISVSMFNNIFANTQTAANNPWAKSFAVGFVTSRSDIAESPVALIKSDNNIFYSNGSNSGFIRLGSLQRREGAEIENLSDWQKASANDADSLTEDPLFAEAARDLRLLAKSPAINAGINIEGIDRDIIGTTRPGASGKDSPQKIGLNRKLKPDIGAYQWKP